MKYVIRLNPRAFNPLTHKVIAERLWEVEQCAWVGGNGAIDSEKVVWHCADVRIDSTPICQLYDLPKKGEKPWEKEVYGVCIRGQDNAIEIHTGKHDGTF